ncbi:MAG: cyclic nucleotide-binding domain-containing protein [Chloroflexi bacterium]|nr:cyclic nucleotide-binding domain-containing protein [Chloroflexota bacterium]
MTRDPASRVTSLRFTDDLDMEQKADFLGRVELFKQPQRDTLVKLASRVYLISLPQGHALKENEPSEGLFIIKSGRVQITKSAGAAEAHVELANLQQGSVFGEIGLIDGLPRTATITALEPTDCYFLPRPVFLPASQESPEIALGLLPVLAAMVRNADQIAQTLLSLLMKAK